MATKKTFKDNPAFQFLSTPTDERADQSAATPQPMPTAAPDTVTAPRAGTMQPPPGYKVSQAFIEKRSKRVQIVLQPTAYEKAKAAADAQGISFNEYIHRLIDTDTKGE